ncbi:hypothetical protein B4U79_02459, partial [Dinothrombium tinctorium]
MDGNHEPDGPKQQRSENKGTSFTWLQEKRFSQGKFWPPLTAVHREARLSFASKHLTDSTDWSTVIFSDEKKFNLDDPDGFAYFGTISFREHLVPLFSVAWLLSVVMLMPLVTRHLKRTFSPRGTMHLWPDLDWFRANGMSVIDWPARCPDLNPIENLWGCLAREVYKNSRQVENISELDSEIQFAWVNFDSEL